MDKLELFGSIYADYRDRFLRDVRDKVRKAIFYLDIGWRLALFAPFFVAIMLLNGIGWWFGE